MQEISKRTLLSSFLRRQKWLLVLTIVLGLLSNIFTLLIPIGISKYYELFFGITAKKTVVFELLPLGWFSSVPNFIISFLVMVALRQLFYFLQRYYTAYLGELFVKELREKLFAHQMKISLSVYEARGTGKYLLRYSGDLSSIRRYLAVGIIRFIIDIILIAGAVLTLFLLNRVLVMVVIGGVLLAAGIVFLLNRYLHKASLSLRDRKSGMLEFVNRSLLSVETIKSFERNAIIEKRFNKRSDTIFRQSMKYHFLNSMISSIIPGVLYICLVGVLYVAYLLVNHHGALSVGKQTIYTDQLLAYLLIMITVLPVFRRFLKVTTRWKLGNISFSKLVRVLSTETDLSSTQRPHTENAAQGKVSFSNYALANQKGDILVMNRNFGFEIGETTALVFSQKNWQSRFIRELIGLKDVAIGDIQLNGRSITLPGNESRMGKITVLSMRLPLNGKTVYESIAPSKSAKKKKKATEMLNRLLKNSGSDNQLKIDEFLSEQSASLSDSHRFTLVAARAFLSKADIFIIEDAARMSKFENFSEVLDILNELKARKKTILFLESTSPSVQLQPLINNVISLNDAI